MGYKIIAVIFNKVNFNKMVIVLCNLQILYIIMIAYSKKIVNNYHRRKYRNVYTTLFKGFKILINKIDKLLANYS